MSTYSNRYSPGPAAAFASASSATSDVDSSAVPTLRVMRLQSPELHVANSLTASSSHFGGSMLRSALSLPDSLTVYVGERFTAYLGVVNSSKTSQIRRLSVSAQLQTPTQRYPLPCPRLENGTVVPPEQFVDGIVSRMIEEPGQHILRVEVGYGIAEGGTKTFRKFYRFQVQDPLRIQHHVVRMGDSQCFVSVSVETNSAESTPSAAATVPMAPPLLISAFQFETAPGLVAQCIGAPTANTIVNSMDDNNRSLSAVDLYDQACWIRPGGGSGKFLFEVTAQSQEAILRGIAAGDYIGKVVFTWRKAMGETGILNNNTSQQQQQFLIHAPSLEIAHEKFVVHRSGLSVDVAASAAAIPTATTSRGGVGGRLLADHLPVTVETIDPPKIMTLHQTATIQFLIVNHSPKPLSSLQLRFDHDEDDDGIHPPSIAVWGTSFQNVGEIPAQGGSTVTALEFVPLQAGLQSLSNCSVVDLVSGREIVQPTLFTVLVEPSPEETPAEIATSNTDSISVA